MRQLTSCLLLLGLGCGTAASGASTTPAQAEAQPTAPAGAVASLESHRGVSGTVRFVPDGNAVRVVVKLAGLEPGPHGFHIHETGDCSAEDFKSAGGHFNPHGHDHAGPSDELRHAGDFGNVEAAADGTVSSELRMEVVLEPDDVATVIGKAVIVHAKADDLQSQPSGAAGPRVACGVIAAEA